MNANQSPLATIDVMILQLGLSSLLLEDLPQVDVDHVNHENPHSFEVEDLQKLIKKVRYGSC